jgi:hypothetical protein
MVEEQLDSDIERIDELVANNEEILARLRINSPKQDAAMRRRQRDISAYLNRLTGQR